MAHLVRRDVRVLIGDADSLSANLDTPCGAMLQGPYRFVRDRSLVRFMEFFFGTAQHHTEMVVPGVGHSSRDIWLSHVEQAALFGNLVGGVATPARRESGRATGRPPPSPGRP